MTFTKKELLNIVDGSINDLSESIGQLKAQHMPDGETPDLLDRLEIYRSELIRYREELRK